MNKGSEFSLLRAFKDENGQVLPWMVFMLVLFNGMAGLTIDLGHAYVCYRELQTSTDAAALAGAYEMSLSTATVSSVQAAVTDFSSQSPGINVNPNLPNAHVTVTLACSAFVTNQGILCADSPTGDNAIQVQQKTTIPTYFIRVLSLMGVKTADSITLAATSTAAMRGAANSQYNVNIMVDTTNSMSNNDTDANCGNTRIYCALQGVQTLLDDLSPCTPSSTSKQCTPFDGVSLFTFPNVEANTAQDDTTCPTSNPTIVPYYTPTAGATWDAPTGTSPTYQITDYLSDWSSNNQTGGTLNSSSPLVVATGGGTGTKGHPCNGLQTPGGDGTYYAGAIYAALSSLQAEQDANPGSKNALIILSDGDANSTKITGGKDIGDVYGSLNDQCEQAVQAAKTANSMTDTTVFTIAYGAASSGCSTDAYNAKTNPSGTNISPCEAMQQMATSASTFYSDANASQNKGQCVSSVNSGFSSLKQIFQNLSTHFTFARLIPDSAI